MSVSGGRPERLGILGGTFDPPHAGHVAAAVASRERLGLDRVLFVVANDPWQKSPVRPVTPAEDRLAMVGAAVEGITGAEVSRIELDRGGPSYTIQTVEALAEEARARGAPPPDQFLIVGADVVDTLATWHRVDDLARLVTLVVVGRPGVHRRDSLRGWRLEVVDGSGVDVSSSQVRSLVAEGRPLEGLVPRAVQHCIRRRGLYAVGR
ncbi:MAG TPA: nicotinate-nucleotide adenylyltransferase [Acidimicrobiales bacterium]|nr:nicotinate-nucleotide adenylyltransferase [Acidimicrobiales bacterium]